MDLSHFGIYSDMDGTLLTDWSLGPFVPKRNLESITRFVNEGGSFSIASGRQYTDSLSFLPPQLLTAPSVHNNGALIYDCQAQKVSCKTPLPQQYKDECVAYVRDHQACWLVASDEKQIYQIDFGDSRDQKQQGLTRTHIPYTQFLTEEYMKVVYIVDEASQMPAVAAQVAQLPGSELVNANLSAPIYLECVHRSVDKGAGIRRALQIAGLEHKILVCIGDFFNDEAMLRVADIAACPRGAPQEIQDICQVVTCGNNEGALADLIEYLSHWEP